MIGPASGNPNLCLTWPRASQPTPDGVDWQLGMFWTTVARTCAYTCSPQAPRSFVLYTLSMSKCFPYYKGSPHLTVSGQLWHRYERAPCHRVISPQQSNHPPTELYLPLFLFLSQYRDHCYNTPQFITLASVLHHSPLRSQYLCPGRTRGNRVIRAGNEHLLADDRDCAYSSADSDPDGESDAECGHPRCYESQWRFNERKHRAG